MLAGSHRKMVDHLASFQKYPPIKPGAPDPYVPLK
jgi:hypothetical protein